jgi:hypothetical protein
MNEFCCLPLLIRLKDRFRFKFRNGLEMKLKGPRLKKLLLEYLLSGQLKINKELSPSSHYLDFKRLEIIE